MILIKKSMISRVMKSQEWSNGINPASLARLRKEGKIPSYYGRVRGQCANDGYFYDMKFLQKFFAMEFDINNIYPEYYTKVQDPAKEGFEYIAKKKSTREISDIISSASQ